MCLNLKFENFLHFKQIFKKQFLIRNSHKLLNWHYNKGTTKIKRRKHNLKERSYTRKKKHNLTVFVMVI